MMLLRRSAAITLLLAAAPRPRLCTKPHLVCSMAKQHTYPYPRPSLTVDAVVVAEATPPQVWRAGAAEVLLIQRKHDPCKGAWALPGGFVDEYEPLDVAAARELQEETSVDPKHVLLTQVGTFGDPGRDPRGWTVSVAYAALVPSTDVGVAAADDAADAQWFAVTRLPELAFDHRLIMHSALTHLARQDALAQKQDLRRQLLEAAEQLQGP